MIKAVLDANVLISGLISHKGPPGKILDAWLEGKFHLILSPQTLDELKRVLQYPRIQKRLVNHQASKLIALLSKSSGIVAGKLERVKSFQRGMA